MPDVVLHGFPQSTYVRTARLVCEEKGIKYELRPLALKQPEHLALHPWGKMPVLTHGRLTLFETAAITRYLDEAFDGPALQPEDPAERARMVQWISVFNAYIYENVVNGLYFPLRRAAKEGVAPDRAAIDACLANAARDLQVLEKAHDKGPWMVGNQLTLADLFFAPVIALAEKLEPTAHLFDHTPQLARAVGALQARPSWLATRAT